MDGVALSAKFYEACGREVKSCGDVIRAGGWQSEGGHSLYWRVIGANRAPWQPVRDLTQPGHLEGVIRMVRERWPSAVVDVLECADETEVIMWTDPDMWDRDRDNTAGSCGSGTPQRARILAAIRAAGLEPPE